MLGTYATSAERACIACDDSVIELSVDKTPSPSASHGTVKKRHTCTGVTCNDMPSSGELI